MQTGSTSRCIVVGVDDSLVSLNAARYAVARARAFRYAVRLVHGYGPPTHFGPSGAMNLGRVERAAQRLVEGVATRIELPAGVDLETAVYSRSPVDAILHASDDAAYVVVGHRDRRSGSPFALGSIASRLSGKAGFPVVTVPAGWTQASTAGRPVLVALDGETPSHWPLAFAFHQADVTGTALMVLHALPEHGRTHDGAFDQAAISETLVEWRARYPDVAVLVRFVSGDVEEVLADASFGASLLVVGKPHEYPGFGLWLGSTAKRVLARSGCPLAVVPQTVSDVRRTSPDSFTATRGRPHEHN